MMYIYGMETLETQNLSSLGFAYRINWEAVKFSGSVLQGPRICSTETRRVTELVLIASTEKPTRSG